jgi:hypothetical protein
VAGAAGPDSLPRQSSASRPIAPIFTLSLFSPFLLPPFVSPFQPPPFVSGPFFPTLCFLGCIAVTLRFGFALRIAWRAAIYFVGIGNRWFFALFV